MKLAKPAIGVLASVVLLASVGILYAISFESSVSSQVTGLPAGTALFATNVKITKFNEDGDVTAIRQGTNHITNTGMSIIMGQVFGGFDENVATDLGTHGINGSYARSPTGDFVTNVTGRVAYMEIGTLGEDTWPTRLKYNNTGLALEVGTAGALNCEKVRVDISNSTQGNAHGSPSSCVNLDATAGVGSARLCSARMNVTATAQFQGANCAINSIDEAGIFTSSAAACNGGACGMMFARNTFGSVNLGPLDTLQLEWEFTFTDS